MVTGEIKYTFKSDRVKQIMIGILLPLGIVITVGFIAVQLAIKGDFNLHGFGIAYFGLAAIFLGWCALLILACIQFLSFCRGLPVLIIHADGIKNQMIWGVYWAHWSSLLTFRVMMTGGGPRSPSRKIASCQLIGDNISPNLAGKNFLELNNIYDQKIERIAGLANSTQAAYFAQHPDEQKSLRLSPI